MNFDLFDSARTFRGLYQRVFDHLAQHGIHSVADYVAARDEFSPGNDESGIQFGAVSLLEEHLPHALIRLIGGMPRHIEASRGVAFVLKGSSGPLNPSQIKRMHLLSRNSYVLTKPVTADRAKNQMGSTRAWDVLGLDPLLQLAYAHVQDIRRGTFYPVPSAVKAVQSDLFGENGGVGLDGRTDREQCVLDQDYTPSSAESIASVTEADQLRRLRQASVEANLPRTALQVGLQPPILHPGRSLGMGIVLPSLDHLSLGTLSGLRSDYGDEFDRFQERLAAFLYETTAKTDERRLVDAVKEMESGVADLQATFASLKKYKSVAVYGSCISLVLFITAGMMGGPETARDYFAAFSGAATSMRLIETFHDLRAARTKVDSHPFWFPFRVAEAAKSAKAQSARRRT